MEVKQRRMYPIPILILFLMHFAPAVAGFFKLGPMWTAAAGDPAGVGAVYFLAFLAGWLIHFFVLAVLAGRRKKGYPICVGLYVLLALISLYPTLTGGTLQHLLGLLLLALPSSRRYFGFTEEEEADG